MRLVAAWLAALALAAPEAVTAPAGPSEPAAPPTTLTLALGGDVQYGRYRYGKLARHCGDAPFGALLELLGTPDFTFVNLEGPVSPRDPKEIKPGAWTYRLRSPPSVARGLSDAGIDVVSVANNHSNDLGLLGMRETVTTLRKVGVLPVGISFDGDPRLPVTLEARGIRMHVFAGTTFVNKSPAPRDRLALITIDELEGAIADRITALRQAEPGAVIVVSLHWGMEWEGSPRDYHQRVGRKLIDAGANVVAGHHTHVFNPVEVWGDGVIFYCLGNLLFDMPEEQTRQTAIAHVELGRAGAGWRVDTVRLFPVWRGPDTDAPMLASAAEAKKLFDRILPEARDRFATPFALEADAAVWHRPSASPPRAP